MSSGTAAIPGRHRILRVLLVDTSPADVRRIRAALLERGEFLATTARTPAEAEQLLADGAFDVALVGYDLWNDQQASLTRFLRDHRADIAVVLLTSGADDRETLPALKLGAHDFFSRQHLSDGAQLCARILAAYEESRSLRRRDTMVRWLEREARTDHLTGLYNRRAFDERLREACDEARHDGSPVTLVIADVAGTRTVNEAHGHEIGDDLIRRSAHGVARSIRAGDFAARVGGDDFGVILHRSDLETGRLIARRIAHEVERLNVNEWDALIPVTLTFGVATGRNCQPGELFAAADQALSSSKRQAPLFTNIAIGIDNDGPSVA